MGIKRTFTGVLLPPSDDHGLASWILEDPEDATKITSDEDWLAWSRGKLVQITVERIEPQPKATVED